MKKKIEPTQINLLIPQTWTQDWDNPIKNPRLILKSQMLNDKIKNKSIFIKGPKKKTKVKSC
jgi:hypothetical protein